MGNILGNIHPVILAFMAGLITWGMTALGAAAVFLTKEISRKLLDVMLGFAAGAMFFVIVEEIIPESQRGGHPDLATMGTIVGFVVMILDVAFG